MPFASTRIGWPIVGFITALSVGCAVGFAATDATELDPTPRAFFAATRNVYGVELVSPVMSCASAAVLNKRAGCAEAPTNGVTTYPVMPAPLPFRATQLTRTVAFPRVTFGGAGASGAPTRTGA